MSLCFLVEELLPFKNHISQDQAFRFLNVGLHFPVHFDFLGNQKKKKKLNIKLK